MKGTIGFYGTWRAPINSDIYQLAEEIGAIAARRGHVVLTGAYSGIMEAAPKGARQVGGRTSGYAWSALESLLTPNAFLDEVITFSALEDRLARVVADADVCVFFPGRTGTIAELALATEMRAKGEMHFPLVLIGEFWESFFEWLERSNTALGFPSDSMSAGELRVRIDTAEQFDQFLRKYEHHWY
jgi:uncharacterized protein (TIGR00725 family)